MTGDSGKSEILHSCTVVNSTQLLIPYKNFRSLSELLISWQYPVL